MAYGFLDIAVTPSVKAAQAEMGADGLWSDFRGHREFDRFTDGETAFIESRDSFYMASVSETGWPYVQHRGGPRGFLKVLDDRTLAFADYRGNRQYISTGNFAANDRASLILMDYPSRSRLKIYAHVEKLDPDEDPVRTRHRQCLQGQARAHLPADTRQLRLELPAAYHTTLHGSGSCRRD